ncbi:MAG: family 43 glycosylhydrolase [Nitrospira sp.]|nr:family 43 glycosylhydrolase [Nitrospira sp.]
MRKYLISLIFGVAILGTGIIYGISICKFQVFPYQYGKMAYNFFNQNEGGVSYGPWAIGVYTGISPFELQDPVSISNPVLTGKDVTDVHAQFVADPFMAVEDGRFYMFFEVLNRANSQGDLGYAESEDGKKWEYKKIILDEPFHLSYPYVFKWEGNYYLIPESHEDLSIRLYRATSFPGEWQFVKNIFSGERYVDPSIFRHNNTWWLFYTNPKNDALNLYYSDELMGEWRPHPMNPVVKFNKHISRPGGRVLNHDGRLYRFTQDDEPRYGIQVFAFEILELSKTEYKEKIVSESPVVTMTGEGWNAKGMHHVDAHFVNESWMATVDGRWK